MKQIKTIKDVPQEECIVGGSSACAGCGAVLGMKLATKALGKKTIMINASGCMTLVPTYPYTPFKIPWIHLGIENAGAIAGGIWAALKKKKKTDVQILAYIGDGATYDIGFQSLSGAIDRNDNFIYVCYNNQSFANTGVQKSSATPFGAYTSTTPVGKKEKLGNIESKKPLTKMIAAQGCQYVATACISYPLDYMRKLQRAAKIKGAKFINLLTPCQPGWGFHASQTIRIGKLAVETGAWPLYEIVDGKFALSLKPRLKPVRKYLETQSRFKHLPDSAVRKIQKQINEQWKKLVKGQYW